MSLHTERGLGVAVQAANSQGSGEKTEEEKRTRSTEHTECRAEPAANEDRAEWGRLPVCRGQHGEAHIRTHVPRGEKGW